MLHRVIDLLFGCHHKNVTRPITPIHKVGTVPGDTYVACLVCGKRLHYDLATMQVGRPISEKPMPGVDLFQNS